MTTPRVGVDIRRPRPPTAFDLFPSSDVSSWLDSLQAKIHQGLAGDLPPISSRSPSPLRAVSPQPPAREENGYSHSLSEHQSSAHDEGLFGDEDDDDGGGQVSEGGGGRDAHGDSETDDPQPVDYHDERRAGRQTSAVSQPSVASSRGPSYRQVSQDDEVYEIVDSDDDEQDEEAEGEEEEGDDDLDQGHGGYAYDAPYSGQVGEWDDGQATPYDEDQEDVYDEDGHGEEVHYGDLDLDAQYPASFSPQRPQAHDYDDDRGMPAAAHPQYFREDDEESAKTSDDNEDEEDEDEEDEGDDEEAEDEDEDEEDGEEEDEDEEDREDDEEGDLRHSDHLARTPQASTPGRGSVNEPIELLESDDEEDEGDDDDDHEEDEEEEDDEHASAPHHRVQIDYDDQVGEIDDDDEGEDDVGEDDDAEEDGNAEEHEGFSDDEDADELGPEEWGDDREVDDEPMEVDHHDDAEEPDEEDRSPTPPPLASFDYNAILQHDAIVDPASGLGLASAPGAEDIASALSHLVGTAAPGHESHILDIASIPIDPELLGQPPTSIPDVGNFFAPPPDGAPLASSSSLLASAETPIPQFAADPSQSFDPAAGHFEHYLGDPSFSANVYHAAGVDLQVDPAGHAVVDSAFVVGVAAEFAASGGPSVPFPGDSTSTAAVAVVEEEHTSLGEDTASILVDPVQMESVQPSVEIEVERESPVIEEPDTSGPESPAEATPELLVFVGDEDENPNAEEPEAIEVVEVVEEDETPEAEDDEEEEEEEIVVEGDEPVVEEERVVVEEEEVVDEEPQPVEVGEAELEEKDAVEEVEQVEEVEEEEPEPLERRETSEEPEVLEREASPNASNEVEVAAQDPQPLPLDDGSTPLENTKPDPDSVANSSIEVQDDIPPHEIDADPTAAAEIVPSDVDVQPSEETQPTDPTIQGSLSSQPRKTGEVADGDSSAAAVKIEEGDVLAEDPPSQPSSGVTAQAAKPDVHDDGKAADAAESSTAQTEDKPEVDKLAETDATDEKPAVNPVAVEPRPLRHNHQLHRDTLAPTALQVSSLAPASPTRRRTRSSQPQGSPPTTRSHCMFHKLQVADGDLTCIVVVPQCTLTDHIKIREERATVLGELTPDETTLLQGNPPSVHDLHPVLRSKLSRIGVPVDDDEKCYVLSASEGAIEERREPSPRKDRRLSSRASVGRSTKSPDPRALGSPSQAQVTPKRNTRSSSGGPSAALAVSPLSTASHQLQPVTETTEAPPTQLQTPQAASSRLLPDAGAGQTPSRRITRSMHASVDLTNAVQVTETQKGPAMADANHDLTSVAENEPATAKPESNTSPDIEMEDATAPVDPPPTATSPAMGTRARKRKAELEEEGGGDLPVLDAGDDGPEAKRHAAEQGTSGEPQPKRSRWGRFWPFG